MKVRRIRRRWTTMRQHLQNLRRENTRASNRTYLHALVPALRSLATRDERNQRRLAMVHGIIHTRALVLFNPKKLKRVELSEDEVPTKENIKKRRKAAQNVINFE